MRLLSFARSRWPALALFGLVVLQVVLLADLLAPGEPSGGDLSIHMAETAHLARAVGDGDLAFWNPHANLGFASGYYYQVLPQLVTALPMALGVPTLVAFKLSMLAALTLLPISVWRALRISGVEQVPALGGATAVALVSSHSTWGLGADSMFSIGLFTQAWAMLCFPLALAWLARWLCRGEGLLPAFAWTLLCGLCHPFLAVALVPAVVLLPWWRAGALVAARRAALVAGIVIAASAFFWLPILVHYDSFGGFPARVAGEDGMSPADFGGMLVRGALLDGWVVPLLTILLVPAIVFATRRRDALAVLLAQGALYALLIVLGPIVGKTRDDLLPAIRFLAPMQLLFGAAAGVAAAMLLRALWSWLRQRPVSGPRAAAIVGVCATLLLVLGITGKRWMIERRLRPVGELPVQRGELGVLMRRLADLPAGRVYAATELGTGSHWWVHLPFVYAGKPSLRVFGAAALQSSPNFRYLRGIRLDRVAAFGVRWVLVRRGQAARPSGATTRAITANHELWELPSSSMWAPVSLAGPLPVDRAARADAVLAWLETSALEEARHLGGPAASGASTGRLIDAGEASSHYWAEVEATEPTTFRLMVTYHPGWEAHVDGAPSSVRRLAPDVLGIDVPAGRHRIDFRFHRPWWTWLLMTVPLLAAATLVIRARRSRQRPPPQSPPEQPDTHDQPQSHA